MKLYDSLMEESQLFISVNILLNLLIDAHFQKNECIAHYYFDDEQFPYFLRKTVAGAEVRTVPTVVNSPECDHGCPQYIFESFRTEPVINPLLECMTRHSNYRMRIIVVSMAGPYNPESYENFGQDALFLHIMGNQINIYRKVPFEAGPDIPAMANMWSIRDNKLLFGTSPIHTLFNDTWKTQPSTTLQMVVEKNYWLRANDSDEVIGTDINVVKHFVGQKLKSKLNITVADSCLYESDCFCISKIRFGQVRSTQTIPTTQIRVSYFVPKPIMYSNWLQLVEVFPLVIWVALLASAILIVFYFYFEMAFIWSSIESPLWYVYALFLSQGFEPEHAQNHVRTRLVHIAGLIIVVLFSSLFASGVTTQMTIPRLEEVIKTEGDIVRLGYGKVNYFDLYNDVDSIFTDGAHDFHDYQRKDRLSTWNARKYVISHQFITETGLIWNFTGIIADNLKPMHLADAQTIYLTILIRGAVYPTFIGQLNEFILRCAASGLYKKWEWDTYMKLGNMSQILEFLDNSNTKSPPSVLNIEHVQGPFWFLAIGFLLSTLAFLTELVCKNVLASYY